MGRGRELDALEGGLCDLFAGRGRLFTISGEPGIGKSKLASAFCATARARGALVLWGRSVEEGGAPAYWPWIQILRAYLRNPQWGASNELQELAPYITEIVPEVSKVFPDLDRPSTDNRFALFDAVTGFLSAAGDTHPPVVVIDDLHAADDPTALLTSFVARTLTHTRILLIVTYRDVEARLQPTISEVVTELEKEGTPIALGGLSEADVATLVEQTWGRASASDLVARLHQETEGNPLFVTEVLRLFENEGQAVSVPTGRFPVPAGIRQAIRQRIELLCAADQGSGGEKAPFCRDLFRVASVVGSEFTTSTLEKILDVPAAPLLDVLGRAAQAGLITDVPGALGTYRFAHDLVREALYGDIQPAQRASRHAAVARAIESSYGPDVESHVAELAHHYLQAAPVGYAAEAVDYSIRAGRDALRILAYEDAAAHYERALLALDLKVPIDLASRCELRLDRADALTKSGRLTEARNEFLGAAELARRLQDARALTRAAVGAAFTLGAYVVDDDALALLDEALDALGRSDDVLRVRLLEALVRYLLWSPRDEQRREQLSLEAMRIAREMKEAEALARALLARQYVLRMRLEKPAEGLRVADEMVRVAEHLGDIEAAFHAHLWRLVWVLDQGDGEQADIEVDTLQRLTERLRQPHYRLIALSRQATLALLRGRYGEARRRLEEARAAGIAGEEPDTSNVYFHILAQIHAEGGGPATELAQIVEFYGGQMGFVEPLDLDSLAAMAYVYARLGMADEARASFAKAAARDFRDAPRNWSSHSDLAFLAGACSFLEDEPRAALLYERFAPAGKRVVVNARGVLCQGPVAFYLGLLATTLGRLDDAEDHFVEALDLNRRLGSGPGTATTLFHYGRMLLRRSEGADRRKGVELLGRAQETAHALGMNSLAKSIVESLSRRSADVDGRDEDVILFRPEGEYWAVGRPGAVLRLKDNKGLHYVARLLANPNVDIHSLDLVAGDAPGGAAPQVKDLGLHAWREEGEHILDERAKQAYKRKVGDLRDELAEAEEFNDSERAARIKQELDFITREIARAVGLGGRARTVGSPAERARVNVTRAIKHALAKIDDHDRELARYLSAAIHTGTYCCYVSPDDALTFLLRPDRVEDHA